MMRLLLIEDDREIATALSQALTLDHALTLAETGLGGLDAAKTQVFDAILLDLNLPDMSGLHVCERLRANGCQAPIIVLSAEMQVMSKIRLLDAGADDYLTKPFSLGELKARLRALRRQERGHWQNDRLLQVADLTFDTVSYTVQRRGKVIKLRRKELLLLECLMRQPGVVLTRTQLGNYAWQGDGPWTNTIDVHIKYLRDKIDRPFDQALIQTVHGLGYKIDTPPARPKGKR
ncbi:MAG TPA: response regulator transcription factor [Candidatus Saccharimonadales bacterium]|nr:response regulator transcription factor [Candidatus Saccharimonadales bacterium]